VFEHSYHEYICGTCGGLDLYCFKFKHHEDGGEFIKDLCNTCRCFNEISRTEHYNEIPKGVLVIWDESS